MEAPCRPGSSMEVRGGLHGGSWSSMEFRGGLHGVPGNVGRRRVVSGSLCTRICRGPLNRCDF